MNKRFILVLTALAAACAGPQIKEEPEEIIETKTYDIALTAPAEGASWALQAEEQYTFEWQKAEGQTNYKLVLSQFKDLSRPKTIDARGTSLTISGSTLDGYIKELGIEENTTHNVYWTVLPYKEVAHTEYKTFTRTISVTRMADIQEDWGPVEDPYIVKVAVIYEDPVYNNTANPSDPNNGKRIHEIMHWNDPHKQMPEYAKDFENYSHGAVKIEIAGEFDTQDRLFCFDIDKSTLEQGVGYTSKHYIDPVTIVNDYFPTNIDGAGLQYDYPGVLDYFGITEMIDKGEVNEVWIYNHPSCHMNESLFMGQGAFWINGGPYIYGTGPDQAHNKKMVAVMFCNYERTVDLALHSFAHRTEQIMSRVYYGAGEIFHEFKIDKNFSGLSKDLRAFDRFFSHGTCYDKVMDGKGYAHIGTCHSPFNTDENYGYADYSYMYTFADEWDNYPVIKEDKEKAKRANCQLFKGNQYGYMEFFFSHIPHFKGLNTYDPEDLHLNNWWLYLFDYNGAKELEAKLQRDL